MIAEHLRRVLSGQSPSGQEADFCLCVVCWGRESVFTALWNKDTKRENISNKLTIQIKITAWSTYTTWLL